MESHEINALALLARESPDAMAELRDACAGIFRSVDCSWQRVLPDADERESTASFVFYQTVERYNDGWSPFTAFLRLRLNHGFCDLKRKRFGRSPDRGAEINEASGALRGIDAREIYQSREPDPSERETTTDATRTILDQLDPSDRELLQRVYLEGESTTRIAIDAGLSRGWLDKKLARARRRAARTPAGREVGKWDG